MAKILKDIKVDWTWVGDIYALKGFNVAITPSTSTPHTRTVITATAYGNVRTYTFSSVVLESDLQYTAWVQSIYKDKDSPWINTSNFTVSDNGTATIETKSTNIANQWIKSGDVTKIDGGKIATNSITADQIGANQITAEHIDSNVISGNMIVGNTITGQHIASNTITAEHIVANSITGNEIKTNSIESKHIKAGSIEANKINAYGLSVLYTDSLGNTHTTFNINSDGQVALEGKVKSFNYSAQHRTGWQITPEGDAEFNGAVVRGIVELPNAGMTNEYDMHQVVGRNLLRNSTFNTDEGWSYVYGSRIPPEGDKPYSSIYFINYTNSGSTAINSPILNTLRQPLSLIIGDKLNISFDFYTENIDLIGDSVITLRYSNAQTGGTVTSLLTVTKNQLISQGLIANKWQRFNIIYTATANIEGWLAFGLYLNAPVGTTRKYKFREMKVEYGTGTPYIPAPEDISNPVRIWAGASADSKDNAPFRIHQNGDVYASNVYLTGTLEGDLISDDLTISNSILTLGDAVSLSATQSLFNNDAVFGSVLDKRIEYFNSQRQLNLLNTGLKITTPNTETKAVEVMRVADGYRNGIALYGAEGGSHCVRESSSGTLLLDSYRQSGLLGDFAFQKNGASDGVKVHIAGELEVVNSVKTTKSDIEMRATSTGWAFYAG